MKPSEAALRFVLGGALILAVSLLGQTRYRILSGLLVLFPIVTVVGFYFLSFEVTKSQLQSTVLFSIIAVPTVFGFLITFYYALNYYSVPLALTVGVVGWLLVAMIVFLINQQYLGLGDI